MQIAGNKVASPWGCRPLILYPQVEEMTGQGQAPPHARLSSLTDTIATEAAGRSALYWISPLTVFTLTHDWHRMVELLARSCCSRHREAYQRARPLNTCPIRLKDRHIYHGLQARYRLFSISSRRPITFEGLSIQSGSSYGHTSYFFETRPPG